MKSNFNKNFSLFYKQNKYFSVAEKVTKIEVSMRTPYRTFYNKFNGFQRIYVGTLNGQMVISNRTPPTVYLLPAGELKLMQVSKGQGNNVEDSNGEFIHSGGYVAVHPDNTIDINLIDEYYLIKLTP